VVDRAHEEDAIRRVVERLTNAFSASHDPAEVEAAVTKPTRRSPTGPYVSLSPCWSSAKHGASSTVTQLTKRRQ